MRRGTTPTITITTDVDLTGVSNLFLTFSQRNRVLFEKTLEDVTITSETLTCDLEQAETLLLKAGTPLQFQIRATLNGKKIASNIMSANVDGILKGGEI